MDVRLRLPREPQAPSKARQAIRGLTDGLDQLAGDIALVVSELVTNSVRHASGPPIDFRATRTAAALELEVCDPMPGFDPQPVDLAEAQLGDVGVGLAIVDVLTGDWGIRTDGQACIWARFSLR